MRIEAVVSRVLRIGLAVSATVIALGLIFQTAGLRRLPASSGRGAIAGPASYPRGSAAVASGLAHGSGSAILEIGLALLVCTPIAAVATAAISYRRQGEHRLAVVGAVVVGVVGVSLVGGIFGY